VAVRDRRHGRAQDRQAAGGGALRALDAVATLADRLVADRHGLAVLGIAGAQGSGKSTVAEALQARMMARDVACALLSLDDLHLTRAERLRLARKVHPLLATRGVPGTHDVALGLATIDALARGEAAPLPRFDKGADDRVPEAEWPRAPKDTRLLILEGWCVGARPQAADALVEPVNALDSTLSVDEHRLSSPKSCRPSNEEGVSIRRSIWFRQPRPRQGAVAGHCRLYGPPSTHPCHPHTKRRPSRTALPITSRTPLSSRRRCPGLSSVAAVRPLRTFPS
jgi:hypothetical protein